MPSFGIGKQIITGKARKITPSIPDLMNVSKYTSFVTDGNNYITQNGSTINIGYGNVGVYTYLNSTDYTKAAVYIQPCTTGIKTATMKLRVNNPASNGKLGIVFRSSTQKKIPGMYSWPAIPTAGWGWGALTIADPTEPAWATSIWKAAPNPSANTDYWVRIVDDGTNLAAYYSTDGVNFTLRVSTAKVNWSITSSLDGIGICHVPGWNSTAGASSFTIYDITLT